MSEPQLEQEVDLQALAEQEPELNNDQQGEQLPEMSAVEQKAFDQGWRPEEDFSGPSENWKTPKEYIQAGEFMDQINALKGDMNKQQKSFDDRVDNLNKYNKAQTDAKLKDLMAQQREAVELSDTDSFDKAQKAIDNLQEEVAPKVDDTPGKDPAITAWETKNAWFNDMNDERGAVAVGVWNAYVQQNPSHSVAQTLAHIDARIERLYPSNNENPRRQQANTTENKSRRPSRKDKGLTMGDLTSEEKGDWNLFASGMFTEEQFLKTVADTRKIK